MSNIVSINHIQSEKMIQGSVNGMPFAVPYTEARWEELSAMVDTVNAMFPLKDKQDKEDLQNLLKEFRETVANFRAAGESPLASDIDGLAVDAAGNYYLQIGDTVSRLVIPKPFIEKIREAQERKLSYSPIIKFLYRLFRNPQVRKGEAEAKQFLKDVSGYVFRQFTSKGLISQYEEMGYSREEAAKRAVVYQTPMTMEGLLSTKKVVNPVTWKYELDENGNRVRVDRYRAIKVDENTGEILETNEPDFAEDLLFLPTVMGTGGDEFYCGSQLGHILKVGERVYHDTWDKVDCNPNHTCVKGLHTGNQDYINTWEREGTVTLNCFVDPEDIGAIPYRDTDGVMRVKSYFIASIKDRETDNRQMYMSSDYAQLKDNEWADRKKEAVELYKMEQEELQRKIAEVNNL